MRYIDWNPVHAGLCAEPWEYPYGSACAGRFPHASAKSQPEGRATGLLAATKNSRIAVMGSGPTDGH